MSYNKIIHSAWCQTQKVRRRYRDLPGGPVVKTSPSSAGGAGSIPGRGARIPHASGPRKPKHKTEAIL